MQFIPYVFNIIYNTVVMLYICTNDIWQSKDDNYEIRPSLQGLNNDNLKGLCYAGVTPITS